MSEERKPLWPKAIEVIGGTGEYESGKTTFGVTICPGPETRVYDLEKSAGSYANDMGFDRVDVPGEMQKRFPNGYKPIDVFKWWLKDVQSIAPGTFRCIVVDPASDIEQGLGDYVLANPKEFGKTPAQYMRMSGLMWGDMKAKWKMILADLSSRCETFYFTTHMGAVWKGDKPSRERKAKGKETLFEMASLYLRFERKKDVSAIPSAVVLKSRLSKMTVNEDSEDGEVVSIPLLPPRIPKATPAAIRRYMLNPPDYSSLKPEELVGENRLTEDEKLLLRAEIASAERDTVMAGGNEGKRLGGVRVGPVVSAAQPDVDEGSASGPAQVDSNEAETEVVEDVATEEVTETDEAEVTEAPPHGAEITAAVEDAASSATTSDTQYIAPDAPVGKAQLAMLRQAVNRYLKMFPEEGESDIRRGITKRNPKATDVSQLTNGQAEEMEASLLKYLNGPHETEEAKKLAAAANAAHSQQTTNTSPSPTTSTPGAGKGAVSKTKSKSK